MPFFSLLVLIASFACLCVSGVCWMHINRPCGYLVWGYCVWLLFILLTQLVMVLNN
jgi:hypothetical protein